MNELVYNGTVISNIRLEAYDNKIKIVIDRINHPNTKTRVKNVLLYKYTIDMKDREKVEEIRNVITKQAVMQHVGSKTARVSKVFHIGGGNLMVEPDIININKAENNEYDYIIDVDTDITKYFYVYRVVSYGTYNNEYATSYVAGILSIVPYINKPGFYKYITERDLQEVVKFPLGVKKWIENDAYFMDIYMLRNRGEVEDYKLSSVGTRSFINIVYISRIVDNIETKIGDNIEIYTTYN